MWCHNPKHSKSQPHRHGIGSIHALNRSKAEQINMAQLSGGLLLFLVVVAALWKTIDSCRVKSSRDYQEVLLAEEEDEERRSRS